MRVNDFINFYQSIDMLIVDDVQDWAGKAKTLNTFFHIFNHLFRNGKRIILASDRPPVELKDMPDRLHHPFLVDWWRSWRSRMWNSAWIS